MLKNKKSLGQNWLKDRAILEEIADLAADLPEEKLDNPINTCLEIGPGLGTLTSSLLKRFDKVVAVEFDKTLAINLPKSFPGKNLVVYNEDILTFDFSIIKENYIVAGNIPYYITTPIIKKLLTLKNKPERIVLLVQKEVAEKILNKHGTSSLSLFVENLAKVTQGLTVNKGHFTPPPKVDSKVIILEPLASPKYSDDILVFVKQCFTNPRKKLSANLLNFCQLSKSEINNLLLSLGVSEDARPADLNLENYATLAKTLKKR